MVVSGHLGSQFPDQGFGKSRPLHCKAVSGPGPPGGSLGCLHVVHVGVCVAGCVCCKPQQPSVVIASRDLCVAGAGGSASQPCRAKDAIPTLQMGTRGFARVKGPGIHALTPVRRHSKVGASSLLGGSLAPAPRPLHGGDSGPLCRLMLPHPPLALAGAGGSLVAWWLGGSTCGACRAPPASSSCFASSCCGPWASWPVSTSIT